MNCKPTVWLPSISYQTVLHADVWSENSLKVAMHRYVGGAAEPCTPVPLIVYIVCPSSAPAAMAKAHSRAAEILQNISLAAQSCQAPQPASLAGEVQSDKEQSTGSGQMHESSTAQTEALDLHAYYRVVVEKNDIVDSKKELGAVLIQVCTL